jgi:hypothetical protein
MIEGRRQRAFKHGGCGTPEYKSWQHLIERCSNPACKDYRYYGARGITVCPQWIGNFATFYADMGARPSPQHSIERLDNNGPYAPDNCQWATREQQATNRRGTMVFEFNGHTGPLRYLAERVGLSYTAVHQRLYTLHWTLEQALSTPPQGNRGSTLHAFTNAKRRTNQGSLF